MLKRLISIPLLVTSSDEGFEWSTMDSIRITQTIHEKKLSSIEMGSTSIDAKMQLPDLHPKDGILRKGDLIWIPDEDEKMQLRICVIGHTGPAGHRGYEITLSRIKEVFTWRLMKEEMRPFTQKGIHCLSTTKGLKDPRLFGPSLHGTNSNNLLLFDFLQMGPGSNGFKYILMIRDDFSSYSWFLPFDAANAENAADALLEWCTTFSVPNGLMSDGRTNFCNETVRMLVKSLQVPHHFTLPCTAWSNGGIERLGKQILRIFRAALAELQLQFTEWPSLVPVLESALNKSPSPQR